MSQRKVYKLTIYHEGAHWDVRLRGKKRFLQERAFLDQLMGYPPVPRPAPDPTSDLYMLNDEQLEAYSAFRKKMKRSE